MYSTGKYTQYSVMDYMGNESKKEWIYIHIYMYIYIYTHIHTHIHTHTHIREGNGTPLQYSCLGNPLDEGAC